MSEKQQIQAFNDQLDHLLAGSSSDVSSAGLLTAGDQAALRAAAALHAVDFNPDIAPRAGLVERLRSGQATGAWRKPARRSPVVLRWGLAAVAIALVALLVVFREPVAASLGRLFGFAYVPGAGFVAIDTVRVIKNPVTQVHNGQSLTVLRGLSAARDTQLWLEYSDGARPADGAWLETSDGHRLDAFWWGWDPDEPGTRGVRLAFPPLPAEVTMVTLALPEGWRIPLEWIPAADSSLQPANLTLLLASPTPFEGDAIPQAATPEVQAQPCAETAAVRVCVQAGARTAQGLELMLDAQSNGELKPGILGNGTLAAFALGDARLQLTDAKGEQFAPSEATQIIPFSEDRLGESLTFSGAQDLAGPLTLTLPGFYVHLPLTREIVIDLGTDPQPGQEFALDETVDVTGIGVHFTRAVVEEGLPGSLHLKVSSEPVETRGGLTPYLLMMGRPDGVDSGFGEGSENGVLTLSVDLIQPAGKLSGVLRLPLQGATVLASGPFNLSFQAPETQVEATQTPQVIEGGEFYPLPSGEALPMDVYQYSGRELQPGDLLAVSAGGETSYLLASTQGKPAEIVAVLPGQVLALYPHSDRGGIDYVTGTVDPGQGNRYEQLYTLRFDGSYPRLLAGSLERLADDFTWSFDGRWLAYLAPRSGPGESGARQVHLVNLSCREAGECTGQTAPSPLDLDLHALAWSPTEERLLALGVPQTQSYGASDVFTLKIDEQEGQITLTDLTELPQIDDQDAIWLPDGQKVYITCSAGGMESNHYGLCRNDLTRGMDNLVIEKLPFNMRLALAGMEGQVLVDRVPVFENGVQSLRVYDIRSGETRTLVEWPAAKGGFIPPSVSPDGQSLAVVEPGMLSVLSIHLADGRQQPILQAQQPLTWVGWVK